MYRLDIWFQNCTTSDVSAECLEPDIHNGGMQELQSHQTLENGLRVAKSDSLSVKLSDGEGSEDNGYSANVLIKAYEASINSGHVMCKACKNQECTQKIVPLFLTGEFLSCIL